MFDPLGLHKEPSSAAGDSPAKAKGLFASPKLWAILLIVDSLFVVVFGGALANNFYQHWSEPAMAAKASPAAKPKAGPAAPAPEPAKPPAEEPVKAPEPPKTPVAAAEPKPVQTPAKSPPPKPSLVQPEPKRRETPKPQQLGQTAPASTPAPSTEKPKALPVEFSIHSPKAKKVQLAGAFIVRGGKKDMTRGADGTWTITVYLTPGTYRYNFLVNGLKYIDPKNSKIDRGASVISVP